MMGFFGQLDWFSIGQTIGVLGVGFFIGIVPKLIGYFKKRRRKKKNDGKEPVQSIFDINEIAENDLKLQDILTELRMTYDSSRAFVYLFHNGGAFLDGSPMKKMSMLYESVKRGVSYEASNSRDMLVSVLPTLIDLVSSTDSSEDCKLVFVNEMKDNFFKHLLESRNVMAATYCPLRKGTQIIGFVGLHYCNGTKPDPVCINDNKALKQYASCIEVCLSERFRQAKIGFDK